MGGANEQHTEERLSTNLKHSGKRSLLSTALLEEFAFSQTQEQPPQGVESSNTVLPSKKRRKKVRKKLQTSRKVDGFVVKNIEAEEPQHISKRALSFKMRSLNRRSITRVPQSSHLMRRKSITPNAFCKR